MALVPHLDDTYCLYVGGYNGRSFKWVISKAGEHVSLEEEIIG